MLTRTALVRAALWIAGGLAGAAMVLPASAASATEVPENGMLRDAQLLGLNGPGRKLSAYLGKPLLINVWASWCGPCKQEMGSLERLAWRDEARRFNIIGISTDDSQTAALNYLKRSNATITHYIDTALEMENMLGADRLPLTVLVDAKGRVVAKYYGAREWDDPRALRWIASKLHLP